MTTITITSLINGKRLEADGSRDRLPIVDPSRGETIGELQIADADEVGAAVAAATQAFREGPWPRLSVADRKVILLSIREALMRNADELADLETRDAGLPRTGVRLRHVPRMARNFEYFAALIDTQSENAYRQEPGFLSLETLEPAGVAALIAPWNAPLALASMKVAACIALGNTCVLKPSEHTPMSLVRAVEIMHEAGLPPGVVNVVNGPGPVTGDGLVKHPDVTRVSFTGGTGTGRAIMAAASGGLKPVSLELGGKSANIVFSDADIERALDGALLGIYTNNGQQCLAGSRILVQRSVADEFIERFVARTGRVRVGDPLDDETEVGPLAFEAHLQTVLGFLDRARDEGDEVLAGGERLERGGYFMAPAAVSVVGPESRLAREEIFGPVASMLTFEDEDEAVAMANDSEFGLVGYVWTENLRRALRVAGAISAGQIWVNTPLMRDIRTPFGGPRASGIGREGGMHSLKFFGEPKTTTIALTDQRLEKMGG